MDNTILDLFATPKIIGLVGAANSGKSLLAYAVIKSLQERYDFNLFSFGLKYDAGQQPIYSVEELETIHNSVIVLDETATLFDFGDRKEARMIERSLRLIYHRANVLLIIALPENVKKFLAAKVDAVIFKSCPLADFINGSRVKKIALNYRGDELGSAVLDIDVDEALVYDGDHYKMVEVEYLANFDSKANNPAILQPKMFIKTHAEVGTN
jgi:GTPase SAR1 family protein